MFYRNILNNGVIQKFISLLDSAYGNTSVEHSSTYFINTYSELLSDIYTKDGEFDLHSFIANAFLYDENDFSKNDFINENNSNLIGKDIASLQFVCSISSRELKQAALLSFADDEDAVSIIQSLPEWNSTINSQKHFLLEQELEVSIKMLRDFYATKGYGIFATYGAFSYKNIDGVMMLEPIVNVDTIQTCDLKSYEYERSLVMNNTQDFLNGFEVNNMLLYGDRGTGKSSTIKAVFNALKSRGLRIVEISKDNLTNFNMLTKLISQSTLKFIIFIDDLNFSDDDENYSALKAALDGGMAARPKNAVIYATSNRRHLVKEHFSEREDVNASDNIQEKLSLADRFGITVTFSSPDQKLYLKIVNELANDCDIKMTKEQLERGAVQWALTYNGRSPRAAKQYINWLVADKKRQG